VLFTNPFAEATFSPSDVGHSCDCELFISLSNSIVGFGMVNQNG